VGRVLSMVATRHIIALEVSMTLMLETVLAPVWTFIFFTEIPPTTSIIGGVVILITIYTLVTMKSQEK
jgi:drug/metabolite transporter (DMT)-like permease